MDKAISQKVFADRPIASIAFHAEGEILVVASGHKAGVFWQLVWMVGMLERLLLLLHLLHDLVNKIYVLANSAVSADVALIVANIGEVLLLPRDFTNLNQRDQEYRQGLSFGVEKYHQDQYEKDCGTSWKKRQGLHQVGRLRCGEN